MDPLKNEKKTVLINFLRILEKDMDTMMPEGGIKHDLLYIAKKTLDSAYGIRADDYKNKPSIDLQGFVTKMEQDLIKNAKPRKARDYNKVGNKAFKTKNYRQAVKDYTVAIENNPLPAYFCNRAEAYHWLGEYEKAISDCKSALNRKPDYARAYNRLGLIHFSLQEFQEAIKCFEEANLHETLNLIYMKNLENAEQQLLKSLKSSPSSTLEKQSLTSVEMHSTSARIPATSYNMSSTSAEIPSTSAEKSSASGDSPSTSFEQPSTDSEKPSTSAENSSVCGEEPLEDPFALPSEDDEDEVVKIFKLIKRCLAETDPIPLTEADDDIDINPAGPL